MAGLGCFIQDTALVDDIRDIMQTMASISIDSGRKFSVSEAYNYFSKNGVEIDIESVAAIYENTFDLRDANFDSQDEVDEFSGQAFRDTVDNLIAMEPTDIEERSGSVSPGKRVAQAMARMFRNANVTDNKTKTTMKMFEDALFKAAKRVVNRSALPQQVKAAAKTMDQILEEAFELNNKGVMTLMGNLNSAQEVWDEMSTEVDNIINELEDQGADQSTIDGFRVYADALVNKGYNLLLSSKDSKTVVNKALIEAGFGRDINKNGTVQKILDWKKLTDATGNPSFIREKVEGVLKDKGYTQSQIDRINDAVEDEYLGLRQSIINKASKSLTQAQRNNNTLASRNKIQSHKQSVDAKRMARYYSYGLFDVAPNTYENILNSLFGMSEIDQDTFNKLKTLGQALQTLYSQKMDGDQVLSEAMLKTAINSINEQVGIILRNNSSDHSLMLKIARTIQSLVDASMRFILTGVKNMFVQNPLSGKMAKFTASIQERISGNTTPELNKAHRELKKAVFKDMVLNGGLHFGDVNTTFVNRGRLDEVVNNISDNKLYHAFVGTLIGRTGLDGLDSRFKSSITEKYIVHNLLKILTHPTNPNRMSKQDAMAYVSERLTGTSYDQAYHMAENIISKINTDAGKQILNPDPNFVTRFAHDIVKAQLMAGKDSKITQEQIEAAYNSAYRSAGRDLGHIPNNFLSAMINNANAGTQNMIDKAVKRKSYADASAWTLAQMFFRNMMNPFVGGGTNWIVLKAERGGLGLVTGAISKFRMMGVDIDLSTDAGMKDLEEILYNQQKATIKLYRGAVGAASSLVMYSVIYASLKSMFGGDDDEERKKRFNNWRKDNKWLSKYTDEFTPEWMLFELAARNQGVGRYTTNYINQNDKFSFTTLMVDGLNKWGKGDVSEATGKFGEALGTKLNLPVPGWRMTRDIVTLANGFLNDPPQATEKEKSRSFWQGITRGGFLETIGYKVNPAYELDALPGVSEKSLQHLKENNITDIDDLKKHKSSLKTLKYKDDKGKKRVIFDKADREKIEKILETVE